MHISEDEFNDVIVKLISQHRTKTKLSLVDYILTEKEEKKNYGYFFIRQM